ncbi:MAG: hypothetical protein AAF845_03290 [Bacteroidota bacterium]
MRLLLLAALGLALAVPASAQTCTTSWAAPVNGDWSEAANWTAGVPTEADTACVTASGTYTVTFDRDQALGGLVVGASSGTQTLRVNRSLTTLGEGTVGANAVVELNGCGTFCGGLFGVTDTLTVEGTLVQSSGGALLSTGGTVDVAPGGTLRVRSSGFVIVGTSGADLARIIVRGTLRFDPEGQTPASVFFRSDLDLAGGTISLPNGRIDIEGAGRWTGGTFDVGAGGYLWFVNPRDVITMSGTYAGTVAGRVSFSSGVVLAAAPGGATLDVGGEGIEVDAGSGQATTFTSAGGEFVNAGRIRGIGNALVVAEGVLRNEGQIEMTGPLWVQQGGVLRNAPGGTLEFISSAPISDIDGTGRIVNEGLVLVSGNGRSTTLAAYRGRAGSEIRVLDGSRVTLLAPGADALPAGASLTGDGEVFTQFRNVFLEGAVSPGTPEAPIDTLSWTFYPLFASGVGDARLVIDVDANGASDLLAAPPASLFGAELGGTLVIRVAEGYTPQIGDTFTVVRGPANTIQGAFDRVVAEGAPADIAFVAEKTADSSALTIRAVERMGGLLLVSGTDLVGGGDRSLVLTGPGAGDVTGARLECTSCFDPEAFGDIAATLGGTDILREAVLDLTSPRAFGFYDLVLERTAAPDSVIAVAVRPFMSFISLTSASDTGVGVRPAGLRYNWSELSITNTSNTDEAGFLLGAVNREAPDKVAFALATDNTFRGGTVFFESADAADPEAGALVVGRVVPGRASRLEYGQRVAPDDVLFPEQTRTGPGDDRLPFGEALVFSGLVAHHLTVDRAADVVAAAAMSSGNATLDDYAASVEAAEAGAVERAARRALRVAPDYTEGVRSLFDRVVNRLGDTVPAPAGIEAAADAFAAALDRGAGAHLLAMHAAHDVDLAGAPGAVRQLVVDEFEALGGYGDGGSAARRLNVGRQLSCVVKEVQRVTGANPDVSPITEGLFSPAHRGALKNVLNSLSNSPLLKTHEAVHATQTECKTPESSAAGSGGEGGGGDRRAQTSASCTLPPRPPAGPPGGGGGACGPPSAPADPNDKTVPAFGLTCEFGTVVVDGEEVPRCVRYFVPLAQADAPITYTVDFENLPLATAPAEIVTITDVLDANLDPASVEVLATSSDSTFSYTVSGQTVTFRFVGIDLPPNVEDPEGKGFVTFAVRPRGGLAAGTEIRNDASIVFDFNPPIETPAVVHEIRETADLGTALVAPEFTSSDAVPVRAVAVNGQGDPASGAVLTVTAEAPILSATPDPRTPLDAGACSGTGTTTVTCAVGTLETGDVVIVDLVLDGSATGEYAVSSSVTSDAFDGFAANDTDAIEIGVTGVSVEDAADGLREVTLAHPMPNPARGPVTLRWGLPEAGRAQLRVFDLLGREVAELSPEADAASGWHATTWSVPLASGVYVVRLDAEVGGRSEVRTRRMVVVR